MLQISIVGSRAQRGFALPAVLGLTVIVGIAAAITVEDVTGTIQRQKERELLYVGQQYRRAIRSYYLAAQNRQYPKALEDLLQDPRFQQVRHIRRLYADPVSGLPIEVVRDDGGQIIGVRSASNLSPFRQSNFRWENRLFEGASTYREWEFIYVPQEISSPLAGKAPKNNFAY